jgi:hypothetical protein
MSLTMLVVIVRIWSQASVADSLSLSQSVPGRGGAPSSAVLPPVEPPTTGLGHPAIPAAAAAAPRVGPSPSPTPSPNVGGGAGGLEPGAPAAAAGAPAAASSEPTAAATWAATVHAAPAPGPASAALASPEAGIVSAAAPSSHGAFDTPPPALAGPPVLHPRLVLVLVLVLQLPTRTVWCSRGTSDGSAGGSTRACRSYLMCSSKQTPT